MNAAAHLQIQVPESQPLINSTHGSVLTQGNRVHGSPDTVPTSADRVLASCGRSLETARQQDIGQRFGHDFSRMRVLPLIQCKPTISFPGDPLEREADDVAEKVVRRVETGPVGPAQAGIQRKCAVCEQKERNTPVASSLQSIEGGEEESPEPEPVAAQRKAELSAPPSSAAARSRTVADRRARPESGGESLTSGTRRSMETAFGRDFSNVRVHRDSEAASLSHHLSALAFTHGSHIYFGHGNYDPEGSSGKRLLAHELTHVVQQGHAALRGGGDDPPTVTAVQRTPPAIQRAATWAAATVHETNNLANTALDGDVVGVTSPTFNGVLFGALNSPTLTVGPTAGGGFDATVATVPANTGSVDETVMGPGPWRRVAPKATIGARFPSLTQCTGSGNSNFRARGDPSDAAMIAANRRHEDHHAADRRDAFNGSVVPWDAKLTAAKAAGTKFHGATDADARAALFAAMGGTVAQVTTACLDAGNAARDAFHATPAGGPVGAPTDPTAAADCSWSFARYHNPS